MEVPTTDLLDELKTEYKVVFYYSRHIVLAALSVQDSINLRTDREYRRVQTVRPWHCTELQYLLPTQSISHSKNVEKVYHWAAFLFCRLGIDKDPEYH